jgi:hypothetical protein
MTTSEKAIQKSMTRPQRSVHHTSSFLWALCHEFVRSTTQRFVAVSGADLPFSEIAAIKPRSLTILELLSCNLGVVAAVEVYTHPLGQWPENL